MNKLLHCLISGNELVQLYIEAMKNQQGIEQEKMTHRRKEYLVPAMRTGSQELSLWKEENNDKRRTFLLKKVGLLSGILFIRNILVYGC